jgi:MerR family transcriptional regulator, thiopeptide resistance regulator
VGTTRTEHAPEMAVAEVHTGSEVIWLHRVTSEHGLISARWRNAASSGLVVNVDDVDAHYERARATGASIDSSPVDQPYGRREYEARDPEGLRWDGLQPRDSFEQGKLPITRA